MPISNLQQLLGHELEDLHSAERQIIAALPKMISMSTNEELTAALEEHLEVSQQHLERLDEISHTLNFSTSYTCKGIQGIITEAEEGLGKIDDPDTRDAAIIASAQRVEHYEIAAYGSAAAFAKELGLDKIADMLAETLDEEKDTDEALTDLAEGGLLSTGLNEEATA